jgi:nicotinamide-nucleotide amidase
MDELLEPARQVLEACRRAGVRVALVEASTGGLVAASLTEVPGASAVLERAWVPYSHESKVEQLGVPEPLLVAHGSVSEEAARALAEAALARSRAQVALAETGIAGPSGGTPSKPVGLTYLAVARRGGPTTCERHLFSGSRGEVRRASARRALELLRTCTEGI